MPARTCKVCGQETTVASKDLKYLHDATEFICSPECVASRIKSFGRSSSCVTQEYRFHKNTNDIDPLGRTAAYSWELGRSYRSKYEVAVAEYLHTCAIFTEYEKYSFTVGEHTYTPDFYIKGPYNCFIEVKGLFSLGKRARLTEFLKEYPEVNFVFIPWTLRGLFIERTKSDREDW